jgi:hypothetical protein
MIATRNPAGKGAAFERAGHPRYFETIATSPRGAPALPPAPCSDQPYAAIRVQGNQRPATPREGGPA